MDNFLDMVKSRRSVRTFDGNGVKAEDVDTLKAFAENITNPYGIDIIYDFLEAKKNNLSSPVISGEKFYITAKVKAGKYSEEAYGYSFEALLIKAHEIGLGTVWIGGTMPREKFEEAAKVSEGEIMPCVSPIGTVADKMSIKEGLMRKGVKADKRFKFEELFFDGSFENAVDENKAREMGLADAFEAVRLAPSAVNKQPWRIVVQGNCAHFYEKKDKGFDNGVYDLQKVDIGIAMYHFEQQLISEGRKGQFEVSDPGIKMPADVEYITTYKFD
ncbi:MAG: nitroreductase [Butyrivibrio sp.]|nr:nitroreductase [Butyrivibrio sp.]